MPPPLTVLIPVYNEERTVAELLRRVADGPYSDKEVIVIDDGSSDATPRILEEWVGRPGFVVLRHERNRGKGAAVRTGLALRDGRGDDHPGRRPGVRPGRLPAAGRADPAGAAEAVYGSRYLAPARPLPWTRFRLGVVFFNLLVRLLYGRRLTDEATCFKAARTELWRALDLRAERFDLCPEMTAKLCRRGVRIREVPISYRARGATAGKKIGWRDTVQTVWTLLYWRFAAFGAGAAGRRPAPRPGLAGRRASLVVKGMAVAPFETLSSSPGRPAPAEPIALPLAERLGAEIVSIDSMALYRGIDVGTAKPGPDDRAVCRTTSLTYSAPGVGQRGWWLRRAAECCRDIEARRRVLFVGGTPLYLKAVLHGLFDGPPVDENSPPTHGGGGAIRFGRLHARLAAVDAASAARWSQRRAPHRPRLEVWQRRPAGRSSRLADAMGRSACRSRRPPGYT